jgi:NADH-quinone oxidoreductase subunit H
MKILFEFLIFPGFLFLASVGCIIGWIDRKLTARIQWRKGPPWYQCFVDCLKLMTKETIIPINANKFVFTLAPLLALTSATIVGFMLFKINISKTGFLGDLIVLVYLLTIPALSLILGAFASANPIASLGASREIKLLLSYELPFILALIVPIIKSGGIKIENIIASQGSHAILASFSGFIAFLITIFVAQAKLGLVPFDIAEAETEIIAGPYIEYSGFLLMIFKLTRYILFLILPLFIVTNFWGGFIITGIGSLIKSILKILLIVILFTLIRNTNPRLRINQAVKFFWGPVTIVALIAVILAVFGY